MRLFQYKLHALSEAKCLHLNARDVLIGIPQLDILFSALSIINSSKRSKLMPLAFAS